MNDVLKSLWASVQGDPVFMRMAADEAYIKLMDRISQLSASNTPDR